MTVVSTHRDAEALTMTFVADFGASVERVWQVIVDARQLERWWGPPTWPATFARHEAVPGGSSHYFMTGPDGTRVHGWWRTLTVEAPFLYEFEDGFADEEGNPTPGEPVRGRFTLEHSAGGTRLTAHSHFASTEQLEQMLAMGMEEGMRLAMGQIDDVLSAVAS